MNLTYSITEKRLYAEQYFNKFSTFYSNSVVSAFGKSCCQYFHVCSPPMFSGEIRLIPLLRNRSASLRFGCRKLTCPSFVVFTAVSFVPIVLYTSIAAALSTVCTASSTVSFTYGDCMITLPTVYGYAKAHINPTVPTSEAPIDSLDWI